MNLNSNLFQLHLPFPNVGYTIERDAKTWSIMPKKHENNISKLGGSISTYALKKKFPGKAKTKKLFAEGLSGDDKGKLLCNSTVLAKRVAQTFLAAIENKI
jgi:hypothetical protein